MVVIGFVALAYFLCGKKICNMNFVAVAKEVKIAKFLMKLSRRAEVYKGKTVNVINSVDIVISIC